jgi:hypothetical protein
MPPTMLQFRSVVKVPSQSQDLSKVQYLHFLQEISGTVGPEGPSRAIVPLAFTEAVALFRFWRAPRVLPNTI